MVAWGLPVARTIGVLALSLGAGAGLLLLLARPSGAGSSSGPHRLNLLIVLALPVALLAALVRAVLTVSQVAGVPVPALEPRVLLEGVRELPVVQALLVQAVIVVLLLLRAGTRPPDQDRGPVVAGLATALVLPVATGHAGQGHPLEHRLALVLIVAHVLAAAAWAGGLGALLLAGRQVPDLARRYSRSAGWAAGAAVLSGVLAAARHITPGQLTGTAYGRVLLVKVAGVALLLLAGAAHRRWALPRLRAGAPGAFIRLAGAELVVMTATFAAAGVLAATGPPPAGARPGAGLVPVIGVLLTAVVASAPWWSRGCAAARGACWPAAVVLTAVTGAGLVPERWAGAATTSGGQMLVHMAMASLVPALWLTALAGRPPDRDRWAARAASARAGHGAGPAFLLIVWGGWALGEAGWWGHLQLQWLAVIAGVMLLRAAHRTSVTVMVVHAGTMGVLLVTRWLPASAAAAPAQWRAGLVLSLLLVELPAALLMARLHRAREDGAAQLPVTHRLRPAGAGNHCVEPAAPG